MKKTKMLIATLVCAVMLMGVGYAWWTDSITLGADVEAGNMNVVWDLDNPMLFCDASVYATAEFDNNTVKDIKVKIGDLYPGAVAVIDAVAENKSTIPVKMSDVSLATSGDPDLLNSIYACGYYFRTERVDETDEYIPNSFGILPYASLADLDDNIKAAFQNVDLKPGDKIFFGVPEKTGEEVINTKIDGYDGNEECIIFYVDHNAEEEIEDQNATITLKFDWKQFNQW